jgi:hypothetical protein
MAVPMVGSYEYVIQILEAVTLLTHQLSTFEEIFLLIWLSV